MNTPRISLCVITGNEEAHVERFLNSFAPAFDELCIVRAVGNLPHDQTVSLARKWCEAHGKAIRIGEYFNAGTKVPAGSPVDDENPASWPHVDDFAAARQMAWDLATGDWQFWADLDDVLADGAQHIRTASTVDVYGSFYFKYAIRTSGETNFRERMFRVGDARWSQPLHENCIHIKATGLKGCYLPEIVFSHDPLAEKVRDPMRNTRIMRYHLRHITGFAYGLHQEAFYRWGAGKDPKDRAEALEWAGIAQQCGIAQETRLQLTLNLADLAGYRDPEVGLVYAWEAVRQAPQLRDSWGRVAELELMRGADLPRAALASEIMQVMPKPMESGFPRNERFYGFEGRDLRCRTLRANGREDAARRTEQTVFEKNGKRFSLLHATRGRAKKALETRDLFLRAAFNPLGVEHIFAIDEDDKESLEALKHYRHVVVKEPRGCVKAWNAAAAESTGHVLVQLSDDWQPCGDWDELCWLMLRDAALKQKGGFAGAETAPCAEAVIGDKAVGETPLVLAVSDGTRRDALLCMAILTRARYEQQRDVVQTDIPSRNVLHTRINPPYLFAPEYFGVFSDNEFTMRAYADKVVVPAQHIIFKHDHPIFAGIPEDQWDETHRRQNARERYIEGVAIFNRRNPNWAIKMA